MLSAQVSNLSRSDGSALFAIGDTIVQAAVYGPTEIKVSKELCDKAVIEVEFKPKVGQSDSEERLMEAFIRNTVEPVILSALHPRTSINIIIQEMQDSGNMLACSINAACMALLDAGVPMRGVIAAVCIASIEDKFVPFPSVKEIKVSKAFTTICCNSFSKSVGMQSSAFISTNEFKKVLEIARKSTDDIFQFYRTSMQKRYQNTIKT